MRRIDWIVENKLDWIAERISMEYACDWCAYKGECPDEADCAQGVEDWLEEDGDVSWEEQRWN